MSAHRLIADPYLVVWNMHLHCDGFLLALLFIWTFVGTAIYLLSNGLGGEGPKPALTVFCGPSAWMLGIYKATWLRHIRKGNPPPVPKAWTVPRDWERG